MRVIFGAGTLTRTGEELATLGCGRALVLSTPEQEEAAHALKERLGSTCVAVFTQAAMHTPVEVTARALERLKVAGADCLVALGGGSAIGLAKALALRTGLPQIAIPTTYAGSEATPILGQTDSGVKTTQRTPDVLPEVIIYDVDLTLTLPPLLSATSGMNAIAHAVEALYARDANPVISLLAEQGITALARALPRIVSNPGDIDARSDALFGAWACGTCLGAVGMSVHHKLCHTLGGSFDLPHAPTHAVLLPHAVAYNAGHAPDAMVRIARALSSDSAAHGLYRLARSLGVPAGLKELGMPEAGLDDAVRLAVAAPYWNPRPIEAAGIRRLLDNAFHGRSPATV
ncbi:maleylacetate reductase [Pseudoduganella dura]|uniref:maleylacetate reductase n=1 Tax=Pseudoduganella dura TaxID=321982 RepID=UPI0035306B1B